MTSSGGASPLSAALCTHYFAIFLIAPELAWLVYVRRARVKDVVWGCVPLAVVALPLGLLALAQRGSNQAWIGDFPIELRFAEMGRSYLLGPAEPWGLWYLVGVVIVVLAVFVVIRRGEVGERTAGGDDGGARPVRIRARAVGDARGRRTTSSAAT